MYAMMYFNPILHGVFDRRILHRGQNAPLNPTPKSQEREHQLWYVGWCWFDDVFIVTSHSICDDFTDV